MAISSYPRTIKNGQIAPNGSENSGIGLMLYNSITGLYEAATPATFGGVGAGGATAANQVAQQNDLQLSTNGGILQDSFYTQSLTASFTALIGGDSKTVVLINLSTNNSIFYNLNGGTQLTLEAGYSVKINTTTPTNIQVKQTADTGQSLQYIVTA